MSRRDALRGTDGDLDLDWDADTRAERLAGVPAKVPVTARLAPSVVRVQLEREPSRPAAARARRDPRAIAAAGTAEACSQLPYLEYLQQQFGHHDLSSVRAHTGERARAAARGLGARAYATGEHVVFGATPDLHTAAHEATHVVQQRAGAVPGGGVGRAGDAHERQADAVAERVVRGESVESLLDRELAGAAVRATPVMQLQLKGTGHVGGDAADGDVLEDWSAVDAGLPGAQPRQIAPGQQGYSELMLEEVELSDGLFAHLAEGDLLPAATANLAGVNKLIDWQAGVVGRFAQEEKDTSLWTGNPGAHLIEKTDRQEREEARLGMLYEQRSTIAQRVNGYNQWRAMPNRAIMEGEGVALMQQNLGISSTEAMVAKLRKGVADAKKLMALAGTKYKNDPAYQAAKNAVPKADDSVTARAKDCQLALDDVNTQYKGFQSAMLKIESGTEKKEGADDAKRLKQIADIKAAIRTAAASVDSGLAGLSSAPQQLSSLLDKSTSLKNQWQGKEPAAAKLSDAWTEANEAQGLQLPPPNPVTAGADYDIPAPQGVGGAVATVAGAAADLYYAGEIKKLNINLSTIAAKCSQLEGLSVKLDIAKDIEMFKNALAKLSKATEDLRTAIKARKAAYKQFGEALDTLARRYGAEVGVSLSGNREVFATIFTLSGQIRSAVSLASQASAAQGTLTPGALKAWYQQMKAARQGASYQHPLPMGPESHAIGTMVGATRSWEQKKRGFDRYAALDGEIAALMSSLGGVASGGAF